MILSKTCIAAAAFCREHDVDIAQLAVQFALRNPRIHTTLIGTANPDNMHRNVEWLSAPYDEAMVVEVQEILAPIRDRAWVVGRPENN